MMVDKGIVKHIGIYLGGEEVAHNAPGKGVVIDTVANFANGREISWCRNGGISIQLLMERFREFHDRNQEYGFLQNNCEQLSSFLETGKVDSPQVKGGLSGAFAGLATAKVLSIRSGWGLLALVVAGGVVGTKIAAPTER